MSRAKRSYHHGNLKEDTRGHAVKVLEKSGVHDLKLRELAGDLGVSHGALFKHFSSRDDLLFKIAEKGFGLLLAELTAARAEGVKLSVALNNLGLAYFEF